MPKVSIIVPIYNVELYLRRCVDSVLNQTFSDFELILVNDGSPDNCGVICDEYAAKDSRIQVIHKENSGVSSARNAALEQITGEYVTFCDSDDRYLESWIENLVTAAEQSKADVAIGNFQEVREDGSLGSKTDHEVGEYVLNTAEDIADYCVHKILEWKHGCECWTRLFRTDILRENHIRFCESCGNYAEDMGFCLEYTLYAKRIVSTPVAGYMYTLRGGSMMHGSANKVKLGSLNEVSRQFIDRAKACQDPRGLNKILPVLHYAIMYTEYQKLLYQECDYDLCAAFGQIKNAAHWRSYTSKIFGCWTELKRYYGKYAARTAMVLSWCYLFRDWRLFQFWRNKMRNSD